MKLYKYQKIPIVFIILSVILLICLFFLSFSDKFGQAKERLQTSIVSGIFSDVMESASGLVSYNVNKESETYPFPLNMASEFYSIHNFVSASTINSQINEMRIYETNINENVKAEKENNIRNNIMSFNKVINENLTKEYVLSNGAIFNVNEYQDYIGIGSLNNKMELPVSIMDGAIDYSEFKVGYADEGEAVHTMKSYNGTPFTLEQLKDVNFFVRNFYICAGGVVIKDEIFDSELMLSKDMTIKTSKDKPQILIYHTHSQEEFKGSREGVKEDTVVGVGDYLTKVLEEKYGYNVIHDRSVYDVVDGKGNRNLAYNYARDGILKILEENPSIDVIIDLHRDGNQERSIYIDGKETAQIMLFNGLSRNDKGIITRLDNPNLQDNLAFSFQLQLKSLEMYPKLIYKNYLETLRYNLDLRPKSLLLEWGDAKNSLESAMNAVEPFAEILDAVLQGQ